VIDTGCQCLVALARLQQVPAEYSQLRHQFSDSEQPLSDNDLLRAGKALGFKAQKITSSLPDLNARILPAIAKANDDTYFLIARVSDPTIHPSGESPAEPQALILNSDQSTPQQIPLSELEAALQTNAALLQQLKQTLPLITRRADAMKKLVENNLAPEMEYLQLEQERIEQQQTLITHQTQRQQYLSAIETTVQQLNTLKAEATHQSLTKTDEYQRQIQSLTQELAKAKEVNAKQILYAPVDGTVQQLAVHTIGGVVTEAQVLMKLVPKDDYLEVEAVLENKDIGFVFQGQPAEVKVNTFNFTKYGIIDAEVADLTADAIADEMKGLVYKLRLKLQQSQMLIDGRTVDLIPGMTVVAEVKTGKRRLIEYVLSPLLRKADESVRER
jgi:hemolysin D